MSWPVIAFWLLLLPLLQSSAAPGVAIGGAAPDLLLLFALYAALYVKQPDAAAAAWLAGLMRDVHSQNPLGFHALVYLALGAAIAAVRSEMFRGHVLTRMALAAAASLAAAGAAVAAAAVAHRQIDAFAAARQALLSAAYTVLACPVVHLFFDLTRWLPRRWAAKA